MKINLNGKVKTKTYGIDKEFRCIILSIKY